MEVCVQMVSTVLYYLWTLAEYELIVYCEPRGLHADVAVY